MIATPGVGRKPQKGPPGTTTVIDGRSINRVSQSGSVKNRTPSPIEMARSPQGRVYGGPDLGHTVEDSPDVKAGRRTLLDSRGFNYVR
jgi:hypothetical protein